MAASALQLLTQSYKDSEINFGSSSTAASSSANDIILGAGVHSLVVPKSGTVSQFLNYSRVGGADVTMRLVFN